MRIPDKWMRSVDDLMKVMRRAGITDAVQLLKLRQHLTINREFRAYLSGRVDQLDRVPEGSFRLSEL